MGEAVDELKLRVDDWFLASDETLYGIDQRGRVVPFLNANLCGFRGEGAAYDAIWKEGNDCLLVRLEASTVSKGSARGNFSPEKTHPSSVIGWMVIAIDICRLPHVFGAKQQSCQQYDQSGLHPHRSIEEAEYCLKSLGGSNIYMRATLMAWSLHFMGVSR